jgi:hypothetical protein
MLTKLTNTLLKSDDRSCGLFSGGSGNLLFLSYLYDVTKNYRSRKKTVVVLNDSQMRAIQGGDTTSTGPGGFCYTMACATKECDKASSPWQGCPYTNVTCQ